MPFSCINLQLIQILIILRQFSKSSLHVLLYLVNQVLSHLANCVINFMTMNCFILWEKHCLYLVVSHQFQVQRLFLNHHQMFPVGLTQPHVSVCTCTCFILQASLLSGCAILALFHSNPLTQPISVAIAHHPHLSLSSWPTASHTHTHTHTCVRFLQQC